MATRREPSNGSLTNCYESPPLFADIDWKRLPAKEAGRRLRALPLPVSILIETGGSWHALWLLNEQFDLTTEEGRT